MLGLSPVHHINLPLGASIGVSQPSHIYPDVILYICPVAEGGCVIQLNLQLQW